MNKYYSALKKLFFNYPGVILLLIVIISAVNYKPNSFLTGWDNIHSEFDFSLNIKRSLFAVWQEYQGLGLLGGMGHASDLIRQIFLWTASLLLPLSALRYFFQFAMLFMGALGAYFLIKILFPLSIKGNIKKAASFTGALFYLLNLATLQMFYVPFEPFSIHFGFLPWLFYSFMRFIKYRDKKSLFILFILNLLATPQGVVATLFLVYIMALSLLSIAIFIINRQTLKYILIAYMAIFAINAFWLLPNTYYAIKKSQVTIESKINQMSTEENFLRNKKYGNLADTILLKGFWFDNVSATTQGVKFNMLAQWDNYISQIWVKIAGYIIFAISITGAVISVKKKLKSFIIFIPLQIFSFSIIANDTYILSFISTLFYKIPLFSQIFRFPFTKLSILYVLSSSVFFALACYCAIDYIKKKSFKIYAYSAFILLPLIVMIPLFQGKLFYEKNKIKIPSQYFELMKYFKTVDRTERIANFPQYQYWGWSLYSWGYSGSGILWYGTEQPIMDRAFDVWSKENENYYYEISYALYKQDANLFNSVLNKYQINRLLIDKSIINPPAPKALFFNQLETMIRQVKSISKDRSFGTIDLYKVQLQNKPKNNVFMTADDLPKVNQYDWGNKDQAYADNGNYISSTDFNTNKIYPFSSLFSLKKAKNQFTVSEDKNYLSVQTSFKSDQTRSMLVMPSLLQAEKTVPVKVYTSQDANGDRMVNLQLQSPQIIINNRSLNNRVTDIPIFRIPQNVNTYPLSLNINGIVTINIDDRNEIFPPTFLVTSADNVFTLYDKTNSTSVNTEISRKTLQELDIFKTQSIPLNDLNKSNTITIKVPKIKDNYLGYITNPNQFNIDSDCYAGKSAVYPKLNSSVMVSENKILMTNKDSTSCASYYYANLYTNQGYLLSISGKHYSGRQLRFWLMDEDEKYISIDLILQNDKLGIYDEKIIVPSMQDYGRSYSIHFDNNSIGRQQTKNEINKFSIYPIPYSYLTSLLINSKTNYINNNSSESAATLSFSVDHSNPSLYYLKIITQFNSSTIVLSQSYDDQWKAYQVDNSKSKFITLLQSAFPFLFGKQLGTHVMVNNWENGWVINNDQSNGAKNIVIIYLPQYLEYLGFFLLLICIDFLFDPTKKMRYSIRKALRRRRDHEKDSNFESTEKSAK